MLGSRALTSSSRYLAGSNLLSSSSSPFQSTSSMVVVTRRKSPRLAALALHSSALPDSENPIRAAKKTTTSEGRKTKTVVDNDDPVIKSITTSTASPKTKAKAKAKPKKSKIPAATLGRPREDALQKERPELRWVMGIDEAGRGPLAGPVVAAAAIVPSKIAGITDSKKITCEAERERLYEIIVASPDVTWAVAVVDALQIDEINILQATMQAMSMAASALVVDDSEEAITAWEDSAQHAASTDRKGCYVTCGGTMLSSPLSISTAAKKPGNKKQKLGDDEEQSSSSPLYYALVDGNRVPVDLPCEGEAIVKGDSKEYSIAAASILAKVTRDRLMHAYHEIYPGFNLAQHKGYPTKDHMAAVAELGASPIHRRTFAPLKHWIFDSTGKVIGEKEKGKPKQKK